VKERKPPEEVEQKDREDQEGGESSIFLNFL
jgi:hypothetical protein